jgi:hypothetical protein
MSFQDLGKFDHGLLSNRAILQEGKKGRRNHDVQKDFDCFVTAFSTSRFTPQISVDFCKVIVNQN